MRSRPALSRSAPVGPGLVCAAADPPAPTPTRAGRVGGVEGSLSEAPPSRLLKLHPSPLAPCSTPSLLLSAKAERRVQWALAPDLEQIEFNESRSTEVLTSSTSTLDTTCPALASGRLCCFSLACSLSATPCFLLLEEFGALEQGRKLREQQLQAELGRRAWRGGPRSGMSNVPLVELTLCMLSLEDRFKPEAFLLIHNNQGQSFPSCPRRGVGHKAPQCFLPLLRSAHTSLHEGQMLR